VNQCSFKHSSCCSSTICSGVAVTTGPFVRRWFGGTRNTKIQSRPLASTLSQYLTHKQLYSIDIHPADHLWPGRRTCSRADKEIVHQQVDCGRCRQYMWLYAVAMDCLVSVLRESRDDQSNRRDKPCSRPECRIHLREGRGKSLSQDSHGY